ncbi:NAD(P)-dependent alcohol dehydrogenase [Herbaspirillum lusitanum]|uniref:NAD(P)-dependent alcohol dehydrogenase n=1 Tax=Herbaspirillum lusitanum TaxID=213312 RepID=UPI0002F2963E|nr:NAD(P)-dependent alcohol dehydrogenase [Herbaspirillum lusitanum]
MKIRAAVARGDKKIGIESVDLDAPRHTEILVRLVAVGLCHTDVSALEGVLPVPFPIVLGHEGAGVVEAVGESVTGVSAGDHVVVTYDYCGGCSTCEEHKFANCHNVGPMNFGGSRPDGTSPLSQNGMMIHGSFFGQSSFASYALCTERNVIKVRKDAPLEMLGPLACGLQTGAGAVLNALKVERDSSFAVFGAGAVGLSAVMAAKRAGAKQIIVVDVVESRLTLALELGATNVIDARNSDALKEILLLSNGGVNFSLDTSGVVQAMEQAVACLAPCGSCGLLAGVDPATAIRIYPFQLLNGRSVRGIIEGETHDPGTFIPAMVDWFMNGEFPFDKLVRFYSFDEIQSAIADSKSGHAIKPILRIDG